jgi:hypothetical protein
LGQFAIPQSNIVIDCPHYPAGVVRHPRRDPIAATARNVMEI